MNRQRGLLMLVLFLLAYLGLAGRIAWFQLVRGEKLSREAVAMRSRAIVLKEYDRGEILDRNSLPLTDLKTTTALYCLPGLLKDNNQDINSPMYTSPKNQELSSKLAQILDKDKKDIEMTISQAQHSGHGFVRLASDLNPQEQHRLNNSQLTGVIVAPELKRYQDNGFCVHLLGYVGGGNPPRGQAGLEKAYDQILARSSKNQSLTSVFDARGLAIQGLMFKVRQEQDNQSALGLTLDKRIQTIVEESMNKRVNKGAVVVMDVKSREILAMASRPAFNPYRVEDYINDNQGSLNNRALMAYHPGSLFKMAVATSLLEKKIVSLDDYFQCDGEYRFNGEVAISCWKEGGHGNITFKKAFASSCNSVFIQAALKLGRKNLLDMVERLHLTDDTLGGYSVKSGSYVKIDAGDPAMGNAAIGQKGVMLSPLQICSLVASIADDGCWRSPQLVKYFVDGKGKRTEITPEPKQPLFSRDTSKNMRILMESVINEGTGKNAAMLEMPVAGKTGTSQSGRISIDGEEILDTWFAGYFPANNPRWAIVVLAEQGKSGAEDAAPVFKEISQGMLNLFSTAANE